jgi:hypothetical protein
MYRPQAFRGDDRVKQNWSFSGLWQSVTGRAGTADTAEQPGARDQMQAEVKQAYREWVTAQQYFQSVSEPALVDHAIYMLEAAERKYMYLLNQVRATRRKPGDERLWTS